MALGTAQVRGARVRMQHAACACSVQRAHAHAHAHAQVVWLRDPSAWIACGEGDEGAAAPGHADGPPSASDAYTKLHCAELGPADVMVRAGWWVVGGEW